MRREIIETATRVIIKVLRSLCCGHCGRGATPIEKLRSRIDRFVRLFVFSAISPPLRTLGYINPLRKTPSKDMPKITNMVKRRRRRMHTKKIIMLNFSAAASDAHVTAVIWTKGLRHLCLLTSSLGGVPFGIWMGWDLIWWNDTSPIGGRPTIALVRRNTLLHALKIRLHQPQPWKLRRKSVTHTCRGGGRRRMRLMVDNELSALCNSFTMPN